MITEIEYNKLVWYECLDQLDPIKCACFVPHRLRPSWDEVMEFNLLLENDNEKQTVHAQPEKHTA